MPLATLGTLRQHLPDMGDNPIHDMLLKRYVDAAIAHVEKKTGKVFEALTDTPRTFHALDDVDGKKLYLRESLVGLAAANAVVNGDGLTVNPSQYTLWPASGPPYTRIVLKDSSLVAWTYTGTPEQAITVNGFWADYLEPPDDIADATTRLAAWLYRRRDNPGSNDLTQATVSQSGLVLIPSVLPTDIQSAIDAYTDKAHAGSRVVRGRLVS